MQNYRVSELLYSKHNPYKKLIGTTNIRIKRSLRKIAQSKKKKVNELYKFCVSYYIEESE